MRIGRPQSLNPLGTEFRTLYLDPLLEPADICRKLNLSLRTFYNYTDQLNLPTLALSLINSSGLPRLSAMRRFRLQFEIYDLSVAWMLGQLSGLRFKLLPNELGSHLKMVKYRRADISMHFTWAPNLCQELYTSEPYKLHAYPLGQLMKLKTAQLGSKIRLSVVSDSVHENFAKKTLAREYTILSYSNIHTALKALKENKSDYILMHPDTVEYDPSIKTKMEAVSKDLIYPGAYTKLAFHSGSEMWRPIINHALDQMADDNIFKVLADFSEGYPVDLSLVKKNRALVVRALAAVSRVNFRGGSTKAAGVGLSQFC